jgi:F-type H+-transporting ATPase subunit alpha
VTRYEREMIAYLRSQHPQVLSAIRDSRDLGDDAKAGLKDALDAFAKTFA